MSFEKLIFHNDFTKADSLDRNLWNVQIGDHWANNELQHYVDEPKNIFFDNGLVLRATFNGDVYESARINTRDKFSFKYGKVEVVAKVPTGKGTWPAIWLLSQNNPYGHWPRSGEIDIMEHVGRKVDHTFLCLHTAAFNHTQKEQYYTEIKIPGLTTDFHKYGIIWDETSITYIIDDKEVVKYTKFDKGDPSWQGWPFDHEYFLILNLAIGGKFGGEVDNEIFPVDFIIKEIKIYQ